MNFYFKKMYLKMPSTKMAVIFLGRNELICTRLVPFYDLVRVEFTCAPQVHFRGIVVILRLSRSWGSNPEQQGEVNPLQWRHDRHDGVSNHQPHDCLLNSLIGCRSKKTFPTQRATNAENVSIWWRHHAHQSTSSSYIDLQCVSNRVTSFLH